MNLFPRASGILLHPTSLPGRYGIGDLGEYAYRFVDYLADTGQTYWQVLPLGPTGYADSPYQTLSAFAGNPNLISLDKLVGEGWLTHDDLTDVPDFPQDRVDYGPVSDYHVAKLELAHERFKARATSERKDAYKAWCKNNAHWLDEWALFIAVKNSYGGKPWVEWDEGIALRKPDAVKAAEKEFAERIEAQKFRQWLFYTHWGDLKTYAAGHGIRFIGDIPIFVAHDSCDVWANRDRFYLDEKGRPTVIAGVPPDYFSETGQRWGNPLYKWDVMKATNYEWWVARFQAMLELVDLMRIDHFRGFEAYWEIPAEEETAVNGKWVKGPNRTFFDALENALGELPIIAEDLGEITKEVEDLRDDLGLPGMKVLQFAWSDPENQFLPHNHVPNCVVYSGTHDNNTTVGWWQHEADEHTRNFISDYLQSAVNDPAWTLIRLGMGSPAHTFIAPMQDILGLGKAARMNTPGIESGNWQWRMASDAMHTSGKDRLGHLTWLYQRRPDQRERKYGDVATRKE